MIHPAVVSQVVEEIRRRKISFVGDIGEGYVRLVAADIGYLSHLWSRKDVARLHRQVVELFSQGQQ